MFKNRLTLGYLVLVGLPLVFLVSTLRAGRVLKAPPAISGEWTIQAPEGLPGNPQIPAALNIYQTGSDLLITLHDAKNTQFAAQLEDSRIVGTDGKLEATVSGQPGKRLLEGHIRVDGCTSCAAVRFQATKAVARGSK